MENNATCIEEYNKTVTTTMTTGYGIPLVATNANIETSKSYHCNLTWIYDNYKQNGIKSFTVSQCLTKVMTFIQFIIC